MTDRHPADVDETSQNYIFVLRCDEEEIMGGVLVRHNDTAEMQVFCQDSLGYYEIQCYFKEEHLLGAELSSIPTLEEFTEE